MTEVELFEETISWLKDNYSNTTFFVERDIVWTIQTKMLNVINERHLPYKVFNDYPMIPGKRRSLSTDLVIVNSQDQVKVAAEFKYEPSHSRVDIRENKFPVVFWGNEGVGKDITRIHTFVNEGSACAAYSIFIDEGGHFHKHNPHLGSSWIDWGNGIWVLQSKVESKI